MKIECPNRKDYRTYRLLINLHHWSGFEHKLIQVSSSTLSNKCSARLSTILFCCIAIIKSKHSLSTASYCLWLNLLLYIFHICMLLLGYWSNFPVLLRSYHSKLSIIFLFQNRYLHLLTAIFFAFLPRITNRGIQKERWNNNCCCLQICCIYCIIS